MFGLDVRFDRVVYMINFGFDQKTINHVTNFSHENSQKNAINSNQSGRALEIALYSEA
jgi:hypothetical protein